MTTSTPILTGRDLGAAERATRALLNRLLEDVAMPFPEWTVVFTLGTDGPQPRGRLVARQVDGLKVTEATGAATVDRVVSAGLAAPVDPGDPTSHLALTEAGRAIFEQVSAGIADIAADVYGTVPEHDLEVTRRTLAEVTRRANARLAATA
jgi:DNA-binding MarR family transcriptional regulator